MGVYNGAATLQATIDGVLSQEGVRLELIVVDDGSSDATPSVLESYAARDGRVRVRRQGRLGLTRALITGCAAARADFIARQDCGDVSLPGRLSRQLARLCESPAACLISAGTEFVGPRGERLYEVKDTDASLDKGLGETHPRRTRGPSHHGATMFSRRRYLAVGGYRPAFPLAQDLDLWMRLWERGPCLAVPEILYRARLDPDGVSARRRPEQIAYKRVIVDGAKARRRGRPDLSETEARRIAASPPAPSATAAEFSYFLGRVLEASSPETAESYLRQAVAENPLFARAWIASARLAARRWRGRLG
jgi:glycosyltransferase involved in cell wall biosynthesis